VKLSAVRTNEGRLYQTVGHSMRADEQQLFVDEDC